MLQTVVRDERHRRQQSTLFCSHAPDVAVPHKFTHLVHATELHFQTDLPPCPAFGRDDVVNTTLQPVGHLDCDLQCLVVPSVFVRVEQPRHDLVKRVQGGPRPALVVLHGLDLAEIVC